MVRGGEFDMKYSKLHWGERRDGAVSDDTVFQFTKFTGQIMRLGLNTKADPLRLKSGSECRVGGGEEATQ